VYCAFDLLKYSIYINVCNVVVESLHNRGSTTFKISKRETKSKYDVASEKKVFKTPVPIEYSNNEESLHTSPLSKKG
jgi:hypothetical protein